MADFTGTPMPDGTVEFEHGVENHPDFIQTAEYVFGDLTEDKQRMRTEWHAWLAAGFPGLREYLSDRGPFGEEVSTFQPVVRERTERELGQHMRCVFLERIGQQADEFAGWLLSNPAQLEKWRKERDDAEAERQWEESQRRYA